MDASSPALVRFESKMLTLALTTSRTKFEKELDALGRDGWIIRSSGTLGALHVFLQRPLP